MADEVLVLAEQADGQVSDTTHELLGGPGRWPGSGRSGGGGPARRPGGGSRPRRRRPRGDRGPSGAGRVHPDAHERVLQAIIAAREPRLVLLSTATAGLDLAAALSVACGAPLVSYVVGLEAEGTPWSPPRRSTAARSWPRSSSRRPRRVRSHRRRRSRPTPAGAIGERSHRARRARRGRPADLVPRPHRTRRGRRRHHHRRPARRRGPRRRQRGRPRVGPGAGRRARCPAGRLTPGDRRRLAAEDPTGRQVRPEGRRRRPT